MKTSSILVVEDDCEIAHALRRGFEFERHRVTIASDGPEALSIVRQQRFHAIVLDILLPGLDGYAVASSLRDSGDRTPILMLTARDSVADIVRGFDCGAEDYLTKPFSFLELSARVRSLIRRSQPPVTKLQIADLLLDSETLEVSRGERRIHLTPTEFRLLHTLMSSAGHVVRRRDLIDSVWSGAGADNNNIDVAISALRSKIDKGEPRRLLETVRGFGYRIQDSRA